jgi:hypothetical protein
MALPSSGSLSLLSLVNEFGGSGSVGLSEYYRGGSFVPNIPTNNSIPTSGTISVSNFYNGVGKLIGSFNIYSNLMAWNLYDRLVADFGWDGIRPVEIYVNQYAGRFNANSSNEYAMIIPNLPEGSLVTLNIYGRIEGFSGRPPWIAGGHIYGGPALYVGFSNTVINVYSGASIIGGGGAGGNPGDYLRAATGGGAGGAAIVLDPADNRGGYPRIYNYGLIAGGGGGGGGGAAAGIVSSCAPIGQPGGEAGFIVYASGGGGGGGQTTYSGFVAGGYFSFDYTFCVTDGGVSGYGNLGESSSYGGAPGAGGAGMRVGGAGGGFAYGGNGGSGGTWGNAGGAGGAGGPAGGAGGHAKLTYRGTSTTVVQGDTRGSWA